MVEVGVHMKPSVSRESAGLTLVSLMREGFGLRVVETSLWTKRWVQESVTAKRSRAKVDEL